MYIIVATLLALMFAGSIYFGMATKSDEDQGGAVEELVIFAKSYLKDSTNAETGRLLDCSGYTRKVFGNFDIKLSSSSVEQYEGAMRLDSSRFKAGDLVFFVTRGNQISHVGIGIDSLYFIHSPGRGKFVRIDSLTHNYWKPRIAGYGRMWY